MKLFWFFGFLGLFLALLSYSDYYLTFKLSVIFTLALEALGVYLYHKFHPLDYNETPFQDLDFENTDLVSTASKFNFRNSNRRKTAIPCLCSTENFKSLSTGNEGIMSDLHKNLKELILNDKNSWSKIDKLCEISLIDRIQQKQNFLVDLLKILSHIGSFSLNEAKEMEESMLFAVKLMEKDVKKSQRELTDKIKKSGEVFMQELAKIKKFMEKVEQNKRDANELKGCLDMNMGKPDSFDANLKLESKIRILMNKISKNSHKVEVCKDNFLKENARYLETAQKIYAQFLEVNKLKGISYRSNLQCYLTHMHDVWKKSHSELTTLAETNVLMTEGSTGRFK